MQSDTNDEQKLRKENAELRQLLKQNESIIQQNIAALKSEKLLQARLFAAIIPYLAGPVDSLASLVEGLESRSVSFQNPVKETDVH